MLSDRFYGRRKAGRHLKFTKAMLRRFSWFRKSNPLISKKQY